MADGALSGLDVAVLAGGLGTRLRGVLGGKPKILAPVDGRPFLDHLLDRLERDRPRRIVFCLGHLANQVTDRLRRRTRPACAVEWTVEQRPMGTAGALRQAMARLSSDPVLVVNGDTWLDIDLKHFVDTFRAEPTEISLACVRVDDTSPYGAVELDRQRWVRSFAEKRSVSSRPGLVSGGVYLFSQAALAHLDEKKAESLERDFLQTRPARSIKAHVGPGKFIDIGTPEALTRAGSVIGATNANQLETELA